ncbi:PucR family transcriptional regulator [Cellulomonas aerilata]|uniref:Fis family transcriptional regulator n=1 Tax=Cellulomonas aerilata TaxID=515326 RepID=A0A512DF87_9CELL|nr:PucR family transcriptional regulator [Cellulomonas aerilata]GEO35137.1 Fis family transcriptional regulator [Cellulomonas aerilata]
MVTVRDVLALPALGLLGVAVPAPARPVRWVATSELDDPSPFLEGGEVLLTTGLGTWSWDSEWVAYVARLVAVGVAALGLGTGLTHPRVPPALERACRDHGLNLLEIPRRTTFVAVSRLTVRLLQEREQAAARRAAGMQRELTEVAARDRGPAAVVRELAGQLEGGAALLPADGSAAGVDGAEGTGSAGAVWAGTPPPAGVDLVAEVARLRRRGSRASASLDVDGHTCVVQPVGLDARPETYLAVWTSDGLDGGRRGALTTAVALLGLTARRAADHRQTARRLRARALELLVTGDPRTAGLLVGAADDRPVPEPLPPRIRVAEVVGTPEELDDALAALEAGPDGPVLLTGLVGLSGLGGAGRLAGPQDPGAADSARGTLRLADSGPRAERAAQRLAARGLRVGVGAAVGTDAGARTAATARYALGQTTATTPFVRWDDLVDDGVLGLLGDDAAAAYSASFLAPLEGRPDLEATLRSFLRHHGSRGRTAEELAVHRNTVRHRIDEIEAALGRSLDDPRTRVDAWVALQAGAARRLDGVLGDPPPGPGPHRGAGGRGTGPE